MQPRKTALQVFPPSATLEGAIANQWTQSFSSEKCSNAASQLHESAPPRRSISLYGKPCINYLHLVLLFSEIMLSNTHCYKPPFFVHIFTFQTLEYLQSNWILDPKTCQITLPKVELQKILNNFFDKKWRFGTVCSIVVWFLIINTLSWPTILMEFYLRIPDMWLSHMQPPDTFRRPYNRRILLRPPLPIRWPTSIPPSCFPRP